MSRLRTWFAGAVALTLVGATTAGVAAQTDEQADRGPFFAEFDDVSMGDMSWEPGPGFGQLTEWEVVYEDVSATDPRLSGTWTVVMNAHGFGEPGTPESFSVYTGTARLENEEGAWVGEVVNFASEPYERLRLIVEGEDAYTGWTAIIDQADQEWSGFRGVVFDSGLPPMPEPVAPLAE
jgi:hypothetical protein